MRAGSDGTPPPLGGSSGSDAAMGRLAELFRAAPEPSGLPPAALARVRHRLLDASRGSGASSRRRLLSFALAGAALALAGGALARFALAPPTEPRPALSQASSEAPPSEQARPVRVARHADMPEPGADPKPAPSAAPVVRAVPAVSGPSVPTESALSAETTALEPALRALRGRHDANAALAALDAYDAAFPHGLLALDARVARVDANLLLGRRAAALAVLETLPLGRVGRGLELRLVRAELTADHDCRGALPDFDAVLATAPTPALEERALYGRAACRRKLGDVSGEHADVARYLERYPNGRFASPLRESQAVAAPAATDR